MALSDRTHRPARGLRKLLVVLTTVGVVLAPATPALAHNQLVSAQPDRDATLRKAPAEVTLAFLQRLDPKATSIVVSDAGKRPVPGSGPVVKAKTARLELDRPLANGEYTVTFRVVSVDGHPVKGTYTFTVADPTASAAPSATPAPSASPAAAAPPAPAPSVKAVAVTEDRMPTGWLAGLAAAGVLLAAVAIFLGVSRRRRAR
jgi:methionine-rich copper-binding protein CopC